MTDAQSPSVAGSQPPAGTLEGAAAADRRGVARLAGWVWVIAIAQFALLEATSSRYGYHRDELYFIVAGGHAAFGYPDQPPLVPLLSWAMNALAPGSLVVLKTPSALIAVATTVVAALIARELAGDGRAQVIAAACTAVSGFALAVAHLVSTTTPDLLSTTLLGWLAVRAVVRGDARLILAAGVIVGIGVEAKPQVGLVAAVMAAVLLVTGPRSVLRSRWAVAGGVIAIFTACRTLATVDNGVGLNNQEQGLPLMLCTVSRPWRVIWPQLIHFD